MVKLHIVKKFDSKKLISRKIIIPLLVLVLLVTLLEIWVLNRLATYGTQISQLEKTKTMLTQKKQILENQISQKSALQYVNTLSSALGFEHIKNIYYLGKK